VNAHPDKTFILFNPDLEMKGSPVGIRERDRRQAVLDGFKSAYIYLCLVGRGWRGSVFFCFSIIKPRRRNDRPRSVDASISALAKYKCKLTNKQATLSRPSLIPRELGALHFQVRVA
jgi:hypothetical protein